MAVVLLSVFSAVLFGAMTVAVLLALGRRPDPELGALVTVVAALGVALVPFLVELAGEGASGLTGVWPFLLAGLLAPGASQFLFTLAVREAGASRTSVVAGVAPLIAVTIALIALDEPLVPELLAGAFLVVAGGVVLALERERPEHLRALGLVFAFSAACCFATRDNLVRWLALDSEVAPSFAASATLAAGALAIGGYLLLTRGRAALRGLHRSVVPFAPAGVLFGASYVLLFEAYYRGRVSVVSPIVATESLWGVGFSALLLRRHELVSARVAAGAILVVAGGALIGFFR